MKAQFYVLFLSFIFFAQNINAQCNGFTVNAGADHAVCFPAGSTVLNGSISGNYANFSWSPITGLSDPFSLTPTAFVNSPITYTLTAEGPDPNAPNLIFNGDFEQGNTGFTSEYVNNQTNLINPGTYAIVTSPDIVLGTFPECDDHTTGTGNMMVVHGATSAGSNVWCQTVPVTPNTTYEFSGWVGTLLIFPASFEFTVNGQSIGVATITGNNICDWTQFSNTWNSGSDVTATICIKDLGSGILNGYALDDLEFRGYCSNSDEVMIDVVQVNAFVDPVAFLPCNVPPSGFPLDGSASSSGNNITYQWSGGGNIVSGANDPIVYVDEAGTYTLTVTYNDGFSVCTSLATVTVVDDPNFPLAFAEVNDEVNCLNPTIFLDGTGSSEGSEYEYEWTTDDGSIVGGENTLFPEVESGGTYDLLVTNSENGCTAEASVIVDENLEIPDAEANAEEDINCITSIVELDGTGSSEGSNFSYQWTTSDGNIVNGENSLFPEVDAAGIYEIIVTNDENGCTNTADVEISEDINEPTAEIETPNAADCVSSEVILDASGSSGSGNLSAEWTTDDGIIVSGENTLMPTVDGTGTYTVILTDDANGCTTEAEVFVDENTTPPETNIETPALVNCANSIINLDATGSTGAGNLLAEWTTDDGIILNGETTLEPEVDGQGTYTLIITDESNGCTATEEVTVDGDFEEPTIEIETPEMLTCSVNSVQIDATNSSNGMNFSYSWTTADGNISNGENTLEPEVDQSGNYELTITNNDNGCTSTDNINVDADLAEPTAEAGNSAELDCEANAVELDASDSSQGSNFEYEWTTPDGNITSETDTLIAEADAAGTYIFTVTNTENDCVATDTTEVTLNADFPTADAGTAEDFDCMTEEIDLNGENSSQGDDFEYEWTAVSGNIVSGENTLMPTIDSAGIYVISVTDTTNNCVSTDTITVSEDFDLPTADAGANLEIPCHPDTLDLNGNNSSQGANFEYEWTTANGNIVGGSMNIIAEINASGTYTLQVLNTENGCTATSEVEVTQAPNPTVSIDNQSNVNCNGDENGSATAVGSGGTPDYIFEWSSGGTEATETDLTAGTYQVTITDKNGCQNTTEVTISEPPVLNVDMEGTAETGFGLNDGTATATPDGGTSDYTFEWSNGETTPTISDLEPGDYCVTITDQNGCTTTGCYAVNPFLCGGIFAEFETQNVACFGENNGTTTIQMTGGTAPFTFEWSNGQSGETIIDLTAQTYNVTATDDNGCVVLESVTVTEPDDVTLEILNITDAACAGSATGAASVGAGGGTPDFNYEWSNGGMESFIENVVPGMYSVTATDQNNCTETLTLEITGENDTEAPVALTQNITVVLNQNGTVMITPQMIDNGSNDNCELGDLTLDIFEFSCDNLGENTVTLTANDVSGNSATATAIVTVLDETAPIITCPDDIFSNFCLFPVNYPIPTAEDLCGDASIELIEGLPSGEIFPIGTTVVRYEATDESGNKSECTFTISVVSDMTAETEFVEPLCNGEFNGEATALPDGGTPPYSYQWNDPSSQITQTATGLSADIHEVIITDATGCIFITTVEITEPEALEITSEITEPDCFGDETGTATALPTGGTMPYSYLWNDGQTAQTAENLGAGTYEVIVSDTNNCEITTTVEIGEPTEVQISLDEIINETGQNSDGSISLTPSGGNDSAYTYEWTFNGDPFSNAEDLTNLMGGEYCVTVTDADGCTQTECFTVEIINSVNNPELEKYISVFPNPTSGDLFLDLKLPEMSAVEVVFYDALGRKVLENSPRNLKEERLSFDLSGFSSGVLVLRVLVEKETLIKRIVIE